MLKDSKLEHNAVTYCTEGNAATGVVLGETIVCVGTSLKLMQGEKNSIETRAQGA